MRLDLVTGDWLLVGDIFISKFELTKETTAKYKCIHCNKYHANISSVKNMISFEKFLVIGNGLVCAVAIVANGIGIDEATLKQIRCILIIIVGSCIKQNV